MKMDLLNGQKKNFKKEEFPYDYEDDDDKDEDEDTLKIEHMLQDLHHQVIKTLNY